MVFEFILVPPESDAEYKSAVRLSIKGCDCLGGNDRLSLCNQSYASAKENPVCHSGTHSESDQGIEGALVLVVEHLVASWGCRLAAERNMGVLGEVERVEPTLLNGAPEGYRSDGPVCHEHGYAVLHRATVPLGPAAPGHRHLGKTSCEYLGRARRLAESIT